jgi:hypothetical protein
MPRPRRSGGQKKGPLREVYVARTVQEPQPKVERFLNQFGRHLGRKALIKTVGSTHLTFLETYGLGAAFRSEGYTPTDIRQFRNELDEHLKDNLPERRPLVQVDPEKPLRWMGNKALALNIVHDEGLSTEREAIEDFLKQRFGELPKLRPFEAHITVGRFFCRILPEEQGDPTLFVPGHIHVPSEVAMNGLETYLGSIHATDAYVATRS